MRKGKQWKEFNAMLKLSSRSAIIYLPRRLSLGVIFYKRLFQGHEQEVELQKAAHNKEIAKIQQQLVRVTAVEN